MAIITNIGDVFQVRLNFLAPQGDRAMNVLHYRLQDVDVPGGGLWAGEQTYDVAPALAEEVYDLLAPKWATFGANTVNFRTADAQNISPLPKSAMYVHDPGAGVLGQVIDDPLPLQDAVTVLKKTAVGGRKGFGRVYVTGFPESAQAAGVLGADVAGDMNLFIDALAQLVEVVLNGNTLTFEPVLFGQDPGPPVVTRVTPIIDAIISDRIMKTQRSRRPGKGS